MMGKERKSGDWREVGSCGYGFTWTSKSNDHTNMDEEETMLLQKLCLENMARAYRTLLGATGRTLSFSVTTASFSMEHG